MNSCEYLLVLILCSNGIWNPKPPIFDEAKDDNKIVCEAILQSPAGPWNPTVDFLSLGIDIERRVLETLALDKVDTSAAHNRDGLFALLRAMGSPIWALWPA